MIRPTAIASGVLFFSALLSAATVTTTTLTSVTPPAPEFGQTVTMVATVTPATAAGFVSFMDGGVMVGTGKLNTSGIAQATTLTLPSGPHFLIAVYGGNTGGGYLPSKSAALYYIVTPVSGDGFAAAVNYVAGSGPYSVAVGDFNGDGNADLAVANTGSSSNSVSVLLGNGNGTFQTAVNYAVGLNPFSVAVGDFNGDGKADLAVAHPNGTNAGVDVLLGNGNGTFQTAVNYADIGGPTAVAVGDFNLDGKADLVAANFATNNVSVLLGNGDGTFQTAMNFPAGDDPSSVAVGDFNGDGKPDLAVANGFSNNVSVLEGNGNGTFQTAVNYAVGSEPNSVAIEDFNGDGIPDLVVANTASNNVSVLIGNGNETFKTAVNYPVGTFPESVAVGDFNGDGKADLVVANISGNNVSLLLGNGDGTFQAAVNYVAGTSPASVAVGDFNGDGIADLAVADNGGGVSVLLGAAPPSTTTSLLSSANPTAFGDPVTLTATVVPPSTSGTVEFLDGTTVLDAKALVSGQAQLTTSLLPSGVNPLRAAYTGSPGILQPSESSVLHQTVNPEPASGFTTPVAYATGTGAVFVAVADFNSDGKADLAVANEDTNNVSILLGNGNGTFQMPASYATGTFPESAAVGDFSGHGKADLVVANEDGSSVSVLLGNGDGTFQAAVNYGVGSFPDSVAVGDFNGDGKLDLAVADSGNNFLCVLMGNGDGTFQPAVTYAAGSAETSIAVSDFNGDGKPDLVVANGGGGVSVLLGNGNGTFQAPVSHSAGADPVFVVVADFNGDGNADLAVANLAGNNVSVLLGNGNGTFKTAVNYPAGNSPNSIAVGDFNGDGKPDLAVADFGVNNVSVLLGNGDGTFQTAVSHTVSSGTTSVAVGEFNGDGRADLAVAGGSSVSILLGTPTPLQFYPITPCRLVDTRVGQGKTGAFGPPSLAAFSARNFPLLSGGCSIPSTAQAYSLNFTVVPDGPLGFLSAWPDGDPYPGVSTLNSTDGSVIANAAIVPAGTSGAVTLLASDPTDLIIDINGYFAPAAASGLDFFPLTPCRIADTRTGQGKTGAFGPPSLAAFATRDFPLATSPCLSGSEFAYSLNVTAVPPGPLGFLSIWPAGQAYPGVSTLNSPDGTTLANAAIVPSGTNGDIDVLAGNPTDVILDINGKFAAPGTGGLQFYTVTPCRVADTRSSQNFTGQFGPPSLAAFVGRNFPIQSSPCGIPATVQAYALNMTVVPPGPLSFLSAWPAGQAYPGVSTLNSPDGYVIANAAIVPAGTGTGSAITVIAGNPTDLIIDIVGYFAP